MLNKEANCFTVNQFRANLFLPKINIWMGEYEVMLAN